MKLKNRFFSIMLSLVLVVSNLYLAPTAFAVDGTSITNGDGIQLTKKATRHTDKLNTWDIDIKLEFTPEIQSLA